MKTLLAATSVVALLAATPVMAQSGTNTAPSSNRTTSTTSAPVSQKDRQFIEQAASGGMAEVKLGQLAQQKASDKSVRDFGQRMVSDHQAADQNLHQVADKLGVNMPTGMDQKDQETYDRLSKLSGAEFDRAYMRDMVNDHKKDVAEFKREGGSVQNPDLRNFVQQTTPVLEQHLAQAEKVQNSMTASGSSSRHKTQQHAANTRHHARPSSDNAETQRLNQQEAQRLQTSSTQ